MRDAAVVCQQVGCGPVVTYTTNAYFGYGKGLILLDNVHCSGSESQLAACYSLGWGIHNCGHHEDAGVICTSLSKPSTSAGLTKIPIDRKKMWLTNQVKLQSWSQTNLKPLKFYKRMSKELNKGCNNGFHHIFVYFLTPFSLSKGTTTTTAPPVNTETIGNASLHTEIPTGKMAPYLYPLAQTLGSKKPPTTLGKC